MKSNNKTTIILLVCAAVAGATGWYLSKNYINQEIKTYKSGFDAERETVPVVVASKDLAVGDVVSTANASVRQIPKIFVPADGLSPNRFSTIEGRQVVHAVKKGNPILTINVSQVKVAGLASLLKDGERAISIPVSSLDTFSGFLGPGDFIDLMITVQDGDLKRTVPLAQDLRVIATGTDLDDGVPEKQKGRYGEITLGVSPLIATRLIHAQTVGEITVLLRKPEDGNDRFNDYVTIDNLVDVPQAPKPEPPPPAPKKSEWGFELIKGGKRS
ncbi:MAG: Flp pilus assembly protein CpaB [Gammaproteobacteria bacterium]|nr:Flp pilus assembly protein CpaB [Gammaproteobacteria bacterium]